MAGAAIVAGSSIIGPMAYGFAAIAFLAQTASDYRKVRKGLMHHDDFIKRAKFNGVGAIGGIVGASVGAATGAVIGTAILPGLGSVIGALIGCTVGGSIGTEASKAILEMIDDRLDEFRHNMELKK
jgi:hypothetical protein